VLHPAHQVRVEDQRRIPPVEDRAIQPLHFHRVHPDRVPIQVEVLRVVARPDKVRRALAEVHHVVAVHVEVRADDDDQVVEQRRQLPEQNLAGQYQQRFT
jgi:hypothetical protein